MSYFIVPPTQYFDETAANLATPERFNAIFNIINQEAVSRHGFIYPIMINLSHTNVALEQDGTPHPSSVIFQEIGSSLAPISDAGATMYNIEYEWSIAAGSVGSFTGATSGDTIEVDISAGPHDESNFVGVDLTVTYLNIDQSTYKTLATSIAVPFVAMGQDGAPAITVPIPSIYAPFNHQPLSWLEPNSENNAVAKITAHNHSLVPSEGWGSYEAAWTLVDSSGNDFGQYITSQDVNAVSLEIPDADKHYTLKLTITNDAYSTSYETSVDLFTYGPGVFFLQWGQYSDIPQAPKFVALEGVSLTHENKLFPEQEGAMEVKWGFDSKDFGTIGIMNYTGQLGAQPNSDFIASAFATAGIAEPTTEDEWGTYGLVNLDGANVTEDITNWFIFIGNQGMIRQAEIIADVSSSNSLWSPSGLDKSNTYLVSGFTLGQTPNGFFEDNVSIASKFERSAVELKHYSINESTGSLDYSGQHDQVRIVSPSQAKLPIRTTFQGVPSNIYFHASVSAAIGSSYSTVTNSYGSSVPTPSSAGLVALSEARPITSVIIDGEQYGVKIDITLGSGDATPVGYLVSYREFASAATIDPGLVPSFDPLSSDYSVLFKKSRTFNVPAKLGRKVKAWVRSVMADGAVSDPVASAEVVVQFPSSFEQSLLREHLGRFQGATPILGLWEETWEPEGGASGHSQYTVAYATFAKKTEIQGVNVWVHSLAGATPDHWDLVLSVGGSGYNEHYDIGQGTADPSNIDSEAVTFDTTKEPTLFYLDDLSITTEAGTPFGINFRKNSATDTAVGAIAGAAYDISVELTYSFPFDAEE